MENEPEIAKAVLSKATRSPYVVTVPRPDDAWKNPRWYVTCLDGAYFDETAHAETIWAENTGAIWIESSHLGSPTSWAEEEYGERGAIQVMDLHIDYRYLTLAQIQAQLEALPRLSERIERYRRTAGEISDKSSIPVELVFDAKPDLGWFLFRARISPKGVAELEGELRKVVAAMKEVYDLTEGAHYRDLLSRT